MLKVKSAYAIDNERLILEFSNGEKRLFDRRMLYGKAFEPLNDVNIFKNIDIKYGVVTWNNGEIDCAPEFMYENSELV